MKAPVFKGVGQPLSIAVLSDPVPGPGDMVVKVERCGICGSDLHMTTGQHDQMMPVGAVMGHEFAGEVVAVAPTRRAETIAMTLGGSAQGSQKPVLGCLYPQRSRGGGGCACRRLGWAASNDHRHGGL